MSGVIPQVAALMGPVRGGHRLHPRARRLRADGQGPRLDGARRPAPRARGGGGGRHAGGARRLARALPQVGRRGPRGRDDEECIQAIKEYLSFFPSHCEEAPPRREASDPVDRADEELLDVLPETNRKPYDMYEVIRRIVDDGEWFDLKPPVGEDDHHLPRAHRRAAGGHRRLPAAPARRHPRQRLRRQGRALRQPLQRVRDPARVPAWTCRASWSAPRSRRRASSATARRCSTRSPTRPCRRSPS